MDKQLNLKQPNQDNPKLRELTEIQLDQVAGGVGQPVGKPPPPPPTSKKAFGLGHHFPTPTS